MDKKLVIANWKSHKTVEQTLLFLKEIESNIGHLDFSNKHVVICPSFPSLAASKAYISQHNLPFSIGAQTISSYDEGAYTGEVAASQIRDIAEYVILGHSERRQYLHETDKDIAQKAQKTMHAGLVPIVCVRSENDTIPEGVIHVAFEPIEAIGSGTADSPEHITQVFSMLQQKFSNRRFIYGGSVNPDNILDLVHIPNLSGFLIGGASLEASLFCQLLSLW